jgi:hypothetical protein
MPASPQSTSNSSCHHLQGKKVFFDFHLNSCFLGKVQQDSFEEQIQEVQKRVSPPRIPENLALESSVQKEDQPWECLENNFITLD